MGFYTIQIGKYRVAKSLNIVMVDTTVKSGTALFSPSWDMVLGHKDGTLSDERYTEMYLTRMRNSIRTRPKEWAAFLERYRGADFALGCYCPYPGFCHRHLLKDVFLKLKLLGEPLGLEYLGEITGTVSDPVIVLDR